MASCEQCPWKNLKDIMNCYAEQTLPGIIAICERLHPEFAAGAGDVTHMIDGKRSRGGATLPRLSRPPRAPKHLSR